MTSESNLQINFSEDNCSESTLSGTLELSGCHAADSDSFVELVFSGVVKVSMDFLPDPEKYDIAVTTTKTQQFLNMTHTLPMEEFQCIKGTANREGVFKASFFFNFFPTGYTQSETFCCPEEHCRQPLPPSFSAKPTFPLTWKKNNVSSLGLRKCDVNYSVTARLWRDGEVTTEVSRPWTYTPRSHVPPPPISVSDFPNEYRLFAKAFGSDVLKLRVYGELSAEVEQVQPILLRESAAGDATAINVPVKLRAECSQQPDITKCYSEFSLETSKFFSIRCQGATIPQLYDMAPTVAAECVKSKPQICPSEVDSWHRAIDENGLHWAAQVNATFYIPAQQPPPPTFSTGFVSLRHTLAMDLKLVNQRGRAVTQSLTFRNPLQIAYASNERQTHVDRMPDLPTIDYFDTIKESCPPLYTK